MLEWNHKTFEPNPIVNHQCHWGPWAEHFKDAEGDQGVLAHMLWYACEEINRLCKSGYAASTAQSRLLLAYVDLVETGKPKPFTDQAWSIRDAWSSIQTLNAWREENKLNIKLVDVP